MDDSYFQVEQFRKMGLKRQPLTDSERETFERVIQLKSYVMDKILLFEQRLSQANTFQYINKITAIFILLC